MSVLSNFLVAKVLPNSNDKSGHVSTCVIITFYVLTLHAAAPCAVKNSNQEPGTACQCLPGFKGEITWNGDSTTSESACTATKCTDFVDSLVNVKFVKSNGDLHDSVANFTCDTGFALIGNASIICKAANADAPWPTIAPGCTGAYLRRL